MTTQPGTQATASRTVLVTGVAGYVAGHLLPRLVQLGARVRCLARWPESLAGHVPEGVHALGVDSFRTDPLAHLSYTTNGFIDVVKKMKELSPPFIVLGGGGYEITNLARAWTLAWAVMNNINLPDDLPEAFLDQYPREGFRNRKLRDETYREESLEKEMIRDEVRKVVDRIRDTVFHAVHGEKK